VLSNRTWVGSALAGYQVLATPHATFEVDAGVRVVWLDSRLMVARAMTVDSQRWPVFGVIGARVPIRLSPQWVVGARGDLALPDFDWSLTGGAEWDLSKIWTLGFGYRYEHIDHAGARPTVQLHSHGPYVGVGFRFGSGPVY
jgi:opacity protein-like surface antigen